MSKKVVDPTCPQCGTRMRGRATCPRGPQCARNVENHETLMAEIKRQDEAKRQQRRSA